MVDILQMMPDDVERVLTDLCPAYYAEAYTALTPSYEFAKQTLTAYLDDHTIVAKDGERIVAIGQAKHGNTYFVESEFDVQMFYIHPDYRGTELGRMMRDALILIKQRLGAKVIYTSCLSGLDEINLKKFINLWGKRDFKFLGSVLIHIGE